MALGNRRLNKKLLKDRTGTGEIDSNRISRASASFADDKFTEDPNVVDSLGPILYHTDLMDEDIDELRRYITNDITSTDNNYTTAEKSKLAGIEAGADVTDTTNVVNALTAGTNITIAANGTISSTATGGGGSSAISDLTDVSIRSVVDGDLIRYNGTAREWQNTNLGLTVTPTLSFDSTQYGKGQITITNVSTYDDPAVFCQIKDSNSNVVVPNSSMSFDTSTGIVSYIDTNSSGTRNIELRVQDFGDLQSELATGSYSKADTTFRYWRLIYNAESRNTHTYLKNLRYYTDFDQSGTAYPSNMTSNTAPTPYVADANYRYSTTYDYWKAFDSNVNSGWWTIGSNTRGKYIDIDLGSSRTINSVYMRFNQSYYAVTNLSVLGSNTSDFSSYVALIDSASVGPTETPTLEIAIN